LKKINGFPEALRILLDVFFVEGTEVVFAKSADEKRACDEIVGVPRIISKNTV
jgi:hypothetical protein